LERQEIIRKQYVDDGSEKSKKTDLKKKDKDDLGPDIMRLG
jgi:hypothetical protein